MKKSVAITTIVAFHAAVIGMLLIQAGCSSEPEAAPTKAKSSVEEVKVNKIETAQVEELKKEEAKVEVLPPEGSNALRVAPTRPAWNMSDSKSEEIVPADQPKVAADNTTVAPAQTDKNLSTYTVQKGDSLAKIAKKHKVSLSALLKTNGMTRATIIRVGQEISIPAPEASAEVTPALAETPKTESTNIETEELSVYVVKKGDYLSKIAKNHKTTVKQLMSINNLKNHNIRIGQKLKIAKGSTVATKSEAAKPAQVSLAAGEVIHTVKGGETLGAIALKYGTSVKAIMEKNSIKDARKLRAGQSLVIVSRKAAVKAETTVAQPTAKVETPKPTVENKAETPAPTVEQEKPLEAVTVAPEAPTNNAPAQNVAPVAPVQSAPASDANVPVVEL